MSRVAPSSFSSDDKALDYDLSSTVFDCSHLECPICHGIVAQPVSLSCGNLVCSDCISSHICSAGSSVCPCCDNTPHFLDAMVVQEPSALVLKLLGSLVVRCPEKCRKSVTCEMLGAHRDSSCRDCVVVPKQCLTDVLSEDATKPTTTTQKKVAAHLIKRMMSETATKTVALPTGGPVSTHSDTLSTDLKRSQFVFLTQPLSLMVVPRGRVSSTDASHKTVHRRSQYLGAVRDLVSMGKCSTQLQDEVRALSKDERLDLLREAGFSVEVPPEHGLAMKVDIGLPWAKLRTIQR